MLNEGVTQQVSRTPPTQHDYPAAVACSWPSSPPSPWRTHPVSSLHCNMYVKTGRAFFSIDPPNPNCRTSHAHSNGSEHRALQHTARSPPAAETAPVRRAVCGPRGPACPPVARTVHPPGVSTRRGARRPGRGAWRAAWSHVARNGWWETGGATGVFIKTWEE